MAKSKNSNNFKHITPEGEARICTAKPGNCPYGNMACHFEDMETARKVADILNRQIVRLQESGICGFAKEGEVVLVNEKTKNAVTRLVNMSVALKNLEVFKKKARLDIVNEMENFDVKTLDVDFAKFTRMEASVRTTIDEDRLKKDFPNIYDDYKKEHNRAEMLEVESAAKSSLIKSIKTPDEKVINFVLAKDKNGKVIMNEETRDVLMKLRDIEDKIVEMENIKKAVKFSLMEGMKESGVKECKVGPAILIYKEEEKYFRIDSKKFKENSHIAKDYERITPVEKHLRVKYC